MATHGAGAPLRSARPCPHCDPVTQALFPQTLYPPPPRAALTRAWRVRANMRSFSWLIVVVRSPRAPARGLALRAWDSGQSQAVPGTHARGGCGRPHDGPIARPIRRVVPPTQPRSTHRSARTNPCQAAASLAIARAAPAGGNLTSDSTYSGVVCDAKYTTKCDTLGTGFAKGIKRIGYANGHAFVQGSGEFSGTFELLSRCNQTGYMSCEPWVSLPKQGRARLCDSATAACPCLRP